MSWSEMAVETTYNFLFRFVQFLHNEEDKKYGSTVQKQICKRNNIPEKYRFQFWETFGKDSVHTAIKRKRQTVSNAFKTKFLGEF